MAAIAPLRHRALELPAIVGCAPGILHALALSDRFAPTPHPVLIIGETGTGKELIAQRIHARSHRTGPLIDVNCASLKPEIAESLLFGHRRGAFSGAVETTQGHLLRASGGTLFLDELGSLHPLSQASLLRVLETGLIRRVGDERSQFSDIRVVGAVQTDLPDLMARGDFRRDLYERIACAIVELPPLRDRGPDIIELAYHFATEAGVELEGGACSQLRAYHWPGNVRELRAVITRAAVLSDTSVIGAGDIEKAITRRLTSHRDMSLPSAEAQRIIDVCEASDWVIPRAASQLGIGRSTLYQRLNDFGIRPPRRRSLRIPQPCSDQAIDSTELARRS